MRIPWSFLVLVSTFVVACGSSEKSGQTDGGSGGAGGGNPGTIIPQTCSNPFAKLEAPYSLNDTIYRLAAADEAGVVFSAIADPRQLSDPLATQNYPSKIMSIDLQGSVQTIWTGEKMPMTLVADANTVYFTTLNLGGNDLLSLPRSGGGQTTVLIDGMYAGPVLVEGKLYYVGKTATYDLALYVRDLATGTTTLLSERGDMYVDAITADSKAVYWTENDGNWSSGADYLLYKLNLADRSVEKLGGLSPKAGIDELMLAGDTLYVAGPLESLSYPLSRVVPGGGLVVVVKETTGAIALTQDMAYYGARGGLVKTPLDFSVTTPVPGTSSLDLSAVLVGPQHVWYAEGACVYRMAR
jgi:hypothetical protein